MKKSEYLTPTIKHVTFFGVDVLLSSGGTITDGQGDYFGPNPFEPPTEKN
jgi:hypothetical protein